MLLDAVVVAGGRSSRLGGTPKPLLEIDGETLLGRALDAASAARRIVVVGPVDERQARPASTADVADLDGRITVTREHPPFGGPVAALAAGLEAFADHDGVPAEYLLVLAADLPSPAGAVDALIERVEAGRARQLGGFIAVDEQQHPQPLLAVYDAARLTEAVDGMGPDVVGASMRNLLESLDLIAVEVPPGSTDDIDTWADAARHGITEDRG